MAKRKASEVDVDGGATLRRRSARHLASTEGKLASPTAIQPPLALKANKSEVAQAGKAKRPKNSGGQPSAKSKPIAPPKVLEQHLESPKATSNEQHYWLMKAEPESRLERGHDIKFSIDDLAAKSEPEPWDGIRAYPARNNLRSMKRGDLAFFYHSSCKVPAIVGIMEIVKEHSPDMSAQDPQAPYFDDKDVDASNPRWSVVHVEFRRKLKEPITLKELREFPELSNMQMLRQSRLSVSRVSKDEWDFLMQKCID